MKNLCLVLIAVAAAGSVSFVHAELTQETARKLLSPDTSLEDFTKATEEATKQGAPAQLLAEAKLFWGLSHKDSAFLAKNLSEIEAAAANFKKEVSAGLSSAEEFRSLISYIKALDAAG